MKTKRSFEPICCIIAVILGCVIIYALTNDKLNIACICTMILCIGGIAISIYRDWQEEKKMP